MNEKESGKLWRISIGFVAAFLIAAFCYSIIETENELTSEPVTTVTTERETTTDRSYVGKWTVNNQNEPTTAPVTSSTAKRKTTTDPYNADEFDDAEDFYYEYYDDFYDYYDAEDYWYEHQ